VAGQDEVLVLVGAADPLGPFAGGVVVAAEVLQVLGRFFAGVNVDEALLDGLAVFS
jgi:hypothetical protein